MSDAKPESCGSCRFWRLDEAREDPNDPGCGPGWCRRDPPVLIQQMAVMLLPRLEYGQQVDPELDTNDLVSASQHPGTWSTDWCGRFERKRSC